MIAGLHGFDSQIGLEQRIIGIKLIEIFRLLKRIRKFLSFTQDLDVIQSKLDIFRIKLDRTIEQKFRFVKYAKALPDIREKTHSFDMVRVFLQEITAKFLGFENFLFVNQIGHGHEFWRQLHQPVGLRHHIPCL